jgi:hypothetical protein
LSSLVGCRLVHIVLPQERVDADEQVLVMADPDMAARGVDDEFSPPHAAGNVVCGSSRFEAVVLQRGNEGRRDDPLDLYRPRIASPRRA